MQKKNTVYTVLKLSAYISIFRFGLFADLFDTAVQNGLAAVQTQNPGFYHQTAAEYSAARRDAAGKFIDFLNTKLQNAETLRATLLDSQTRLYNFR